MGETLWSFQRKSWPLIHILGPDRIDFLQRLSSQNLKVLAENEMAPGAFLNGNGTVIALFLAHIRPDRVTLLCEPQSSSLITQHLEKLHFTENIEVQTELADWTELRGARAIDLLKTQSIFPAEPWGEGGWLIQGEHAWSDVPTLSGQDYYAQRAEALFPRDQVDINSETIILESGLTGYIHRSKGCYPGQEVVERIFTYGNVAKKMVLLEGEREDSERELYVGDKKIGNVTSRHQLSDLSPESSYHYVANVFRLHAVVGNTFSLGKESSLQLKVLKAAEFRSADQTS